ncbi:hypothetical protein [Krasilnikovia sp. MM14-A1259]|uniref:hypothetical protein n=1 Tax=Krasilnikovia sp. MM14-A1259 TaxID=3373539 RepID=UPI00382A8386
MSALRLTDDRQRSGASPVTGDGQDLPKRVPRGNLPAEASRVPIKNVVDDRWYLDDQQLRILLNGLRRWRVMGR